MKHENEVIKEINRRNRRCSIVCGTVTFVVIFVTTSLNNYWYKKKEQKKSDNYYSRYEVTSKEEYGDEMICLVKDEVTGKEYIVIGEK